MRDKLVLITTFCGPGRSPNLDCCFWTADRSSPERGFVCPVQPGAGIPNYVGQPYDLGYAGTIVPLVGERFADPEVVGAYVSAAKHHRDRIFLLPTFPTAGCLWLMGRKHHWTFHTQFFLLFSILIQLYFSCRTSYYSALLMLRRDLRRLYRPQVLSAVLRCAMTGF